MLLNVLMFYFGKLIAGPRGRNTEGGMLLCTSSFRSEMLSLPLQTKCMTSHADISGMDVSRNAQKESKEGGDNMDILLGHEFIMPISSLTRKCLHPSGGFLK